MMINKKIVVVEKPKAKLYTVVRDTKEKDGHGWIFPCSSDCTGTITKSLKTADYSLVGLEDIFCIERKRNTGEFAKNIFEKRFEAELIRMESFVHPFIVCEFTMADVMSFPAHSGIPPRYFYKLKATGKLLLKKILEYQINYKVKIIMAGDNGMVVAESLFRRVNELYGNK